ncbi:MAG: type 4a pilus biogenesis protein PilO [Acidobacteria bacterium]|nr:type 4a pilus biogenesis protein PilO [Acidobacteriota bacterium]
MKILVFFLVIFFLTPNLLLAQKPQRQKTKPPSTQIDKDKQAKEELTQVQGEIDFLLQRLANDEEDISRAISQIRTDLRLRELRWRKLERSASVVDEPFVFHPIKVELFGTYERLTDMLLSLTALNYLVIIDELEIKRAKQPAPLVSVEAEFTILLYSLDEKGRNQLQNFTGDTNTQLEAAKKSLTLLNSRFDEKVACWSSLRRLGKRFPKSLETVLTGVSINSRQIKISGVSRSSESIKKLIDDFSQARIFIELAPKLNGPNFMLQASIDVPQAYQEWLKGIDTSDQETIARDPFTTIYTIEQLTQGSSANTNYPELEKRLEEYLKLINSPNIKRPDRSSPYLVSELALAGLYFTPDTQGAIFKTPNQKEFFVPTGARCYNGKFAGIQQSRALFDETIIDTGGKAQVSQISKAIEPSNCSLVAIAPQGKETTLSSQLEKEARAKLPNWVMTLKINNVELNSLLLLLHELSDHQFSFIIDQNVPSLCVSISRERVPFDEFVSTILHSLNLTFIEENGVFRIIPFEQASDANSLALAVSLESPPIANKFGGKDFQAETLTLSITDVELGEVLKFFTSKYGVKFAYTPLAKQAKITASIKDLAWPQALQVILRANRLGALVENERTLILSRNDLLQTQSSGKAK